MWIMFRAPCPTPEGQTAEDLYMKRVAGISPEMQASAAKHGCRFHRAWHTVDGSEFVAVANWDSREGARAFFREWDIQDEPGEIAFELLGDVGLVPEP
jgi:hypothetical protein